MSEEDVIQQGEGEPINGEAQVDRHAVIRNGVHPGDDDPILMLIRFCWAHLRAHPDQVWAVIAVTIVTYFVYQRWQESQAKRAQEAKERAYAERVHRMKEERAAAKAAAAAAAAAANAVPSSSSSSTDSKSSPNATGIGGVFQHDPSRLLKLEADYEEKKKAFLKAQKEKQERSKLIKLGLLKDEAKERVEKEVQEYKEKKGDASYYSGGGGGGGGRFSKFEAPKGGG